MSKVTTKDAQIADIMLTQMSTLAIQRTNKIIQYKRNDITRRGNT